MQFLISTLKLLINILFSLFALRPSLFDDFVEFEKLNDQEGRVEEEEQENNNNNIKFLQHDNEQKN